MEKSMTEVFSSDNNDCYKHYTEPPAIACHEKEIEQV